MVNKLPVSLSQDRAENNYQELNKKIKQVLFYLYHLKEKLLKNYGTSF